VREERWFKKPHNLKPWNPLNPHRNFERLGLTPYTLSPQPESKFPQALRLKPDRGTSPIRTLAPP